MATLLESIAISNNSFPNDDAFFSIQRRQRRQFRQNRQLDRVVVENEATKVVKTKRKAIRKTKSSSKPGEPQRRSISSLEHVLTNYNNLVYKEEFKAFMKGIGVIRSTTKRKKGKRVATREPRKRVAQKKSFVKKESSAKEGKVVELSKEGLRRSKRLRRKVSDGETLQDVVTAPESLMKQPQATLEQQTVISATTVSVTAANEPKHDDERSCVVVSNDTHQVVVAAPEPLMKQPQAIPEQQTVISATTMPMTAADEPKHDDERSCVVVSNDTHQVVVAAPEPLMKQPQAIPEQQTVISATTMPMTAADEPKHDDERSCVVVSNDTQQVVVAAPEPLMKQSQATPEQQTVISATTMPVTAANEPKHEDEEPNETQNDLIEPALQGMSPHTNGQRKAQNSAAVVSNEAKHDMTLPGSLSIQLQDQSDEQTSSLTTDTAGALAEGVLPAMATTITAVPEDLDAKRTQSRRRKTSRRPNESPSNLVPFPQRLLSKKGQRDAEPSTMSLESTKKGEVVEPQNPVLRRSKRKMQRRNLNHSTVAVPEKTQWLVASAPEPASNGTRNKGKTKRGRARPMAVPGPAAMETRQRKRAKVLNDASVTKCQPSIATAKHNVVKPEVSRVQTRSQTANKRRRTESSRPNNTRGKRARLSPSNRIQDRQLDSPPISC